MTCRPLIPESDFANTTYASPVMAWRRQVLRETVAKLMREGVGPYQELARANVRRWQAEAHPESPTLAVLQGDWGEVTSRLTRQYGAIFAVLNMANAYVPGGGYLEGMVAQEENMFRRTDCHFYIADSQLDPDGRRYRPDMTDRIEGESGRVYLDLSQPRVCVRGPEVVGRMEGYEWLPDDEVFPFYELRAAARDYRNGDAFDAEDARRRICAQLETLVDAKQRHVVLGASGCGAFANPAASIARIYKEELAHRAGAFDCVAFAVFSAGYGPGNYPIFSRVFE
ncbi:MAG: hypothetical protein ACI85K_003120 [Hyphomicrobiaceae bacterium]|jgi:hypothetical protein